MMYELIATVIEQKGTCVAGHKVGDKIDLNSIWAPKICRPLLKALESQAMVLKYGGDMPWLKDKDIVRVSCPDPENPLVVEIKRIKKE